MCEHASGTHGIYIRVPAVYNKKRTNFTALNEFRRLRMQQLKALTKIITEELTCASKKKLGFRKLHAV